MFFFDSFWDPRGRNEVREQREMEGLWGLGRSLGTRQGSACLRWGWLRVCMCVPPAAEVVKCVKGKGLFFHIVVRTSVFFISLCFLFTLKCNRKKSWFCCCCFLI